MMANPSLMREMQRQQDTAMGRLDVMPGGHQALARMHREVLDPLHSSITGGTGDANNGVNTYAEDAQGHRNTAPLANPWGAPQPASQPATPAVTSTPFPAAPAPAPAPFPAAPAPGGYAEAAAPANPMQQPMTPFGANPFGGPGMGQMMNSPMMQQMMQQMMQNPQMMQQAMQMGNQMFGQQGNFGQNPMFGNFAPSAQPGGALAQPGGSPGAMDEAALAAAAGNPMVRARFATQLEGLLAMGFSDEQKCLQALVQCDGNVDRALDRLFADN